MTNKQFCRADFELSKNCMVTVQITPLEGVKVARTFLVNTQKKQLKAGAFS